MPDQETAARSPGHPFVAPRSASDAPADDPSSPIRSGSAPWATPWRRTQATAADRSSNGAGKAKPGPNRYWIANVT